MRIVIIVVSLLMTVAGLGCVALSEHATLAEIDKKAVRYVVDAGITDANDYGGYPNLAKARRLLEDVDAAHTLNVQDLQQALQEEHTLYSILYGRAEVNHQAAVQREEQLFGEKGLLSLGLSLAGFGTLTGLLGLARKRPQDITKTEMESALAQATGKSAEELSTKQKQFIQVVQGVQKFIAEFPAHTDGLKMIMNGTQDKDTQVAVAVAKKEMGV